MAVLKSKSAFLIHSPTRSLICSSGGLINNPAIFVRRVRDTTDNVFRRFKVLRRDDFNVNREVDIGVAYEPVVSAAVRVEELSRVAIGCILPARHALAKRATIRVRDLVPYAVVTYLPQALLRPYINRALSEKMADLRISVQTGTSATAITLAMHGAGIALIETALFAARPVPGFVMRPIEPRIELKSLLLRPRQAAASRVLDDFTAHLKATFP